MFRAVVLLPSLAALLLSQMGVLTSGQQYDEQLAHQLAWLSAGAYAKVQEGGPMPCVQKVLPASAQWSIVNRTELKCDSLDNTCLVYVLYSPVQRQMILVFRGTTTNEQLLLEGVASFRKGTDFFGTGDVNHYFKDALDKLWPTVTAAVRNQNLPRQQPILVTGHSLGGALAALAAMRLVIEGSANSQQVHLITFGEPRVGTAAWAFTHDQIVPYSFRVVHTRDIVPHLPACKKASVPQSVSKSVNGSRPCDPNSNSAPYHHALEVWYPNGMAPGDQYRLCTGQPRDEDFSCSDQYKFDVGQYQSYIDDHRAYFEYELPTLGHAGCNTNNYASMMEANGKSGAPNPD